jgi:hypothetical protein
LGTIPRIRFVCCPSILFFAVNDACGLACAAAVGASGRSPEERSLACAPAMTGKNMQSQRRMAEELGRMPARRVRHDRLLKKNLILFSFTRR